jgi:hypothetical protein
MMIRIKTQQQQYLAVLWSYITNTSLPYTLRPLVLHRHTDDDSYQNSTTTASRSIVKLYH